MLAFAPTPRRPWPRENPRQRWTTLLLLSAVIATLASTQPWVRVHFEELFGAHFGPPGWHSTAGFTCLCTCPLVAMLALCETKSSATQAAARPASLLLVALCAVALLCHGSAGPGELRGVSTRWTTPFWLVAASLPALLVACALRCAALRPRGQSSSGPPT